MNMKLASKRKHKVFLADFGFSLNNSFDGHNFFAKKLHFYRIRFCHANIFWFFYDFVRIWKYSLVYGFNWGIEVDMVFELEPCFS